MVLTVTGDTGGTFSIQSGTGGSITYSGGVTGTFNGVSGTTYTVRYLCSSGGPSNYVQVTFTYYTNTPSFLISQTSCTQAGINVTGSTGGTFSVTSGTGGSVVYAGGTSTTANFTGVNGTAYTISYTMPCGGSVSQNITLTGNASFSMTSSNCSSATSTISGTTGGVFSILSGTGGSINSSTGALTGVSGSTYTVQYTVCGVSSTQNVTIQNTNCWSLNGNAQYITVGGEQCIQLTAEANNQTGCAWNGSVLDFNESFTLSLDYYFGNNMGGADGTTFTFQPNPAACGQAGAQLGAGGIPNSLIIEMDTYDNDGGSSNDLSSDHISVEIDGDLPDDPINFPANQPPYCAPVTALVGGGNIDNGVIHSIDISWDPVTQNLQIYFDGVLRMTCNGNFVNTVFGGDNTVYWGATAATGGLNNQQYFCPATVVVLPAEMVSFTSSCEDEKEIFTWVTASEYRVDHFELEYTLNGLVFYPVGHIQANGNSTEMNTYSMEFTSNDRTQKYFRIKTVDQDGNIETSDLISGKRCAPQTSLKGYIFENGQLMLDISSEDVEIELVTPSGQLIAKASGKSMNGLQVAEGIYLVRIAFRDENRFETYRVFHSRN